MAASETVCLDLDDADEILALGRMVSYACQRSKALDLGMSTYFLEMALMSLVKDIGERDLPGIGLDGALMATDSTELH